MNSPMLSLFILTGLLTTLTIRSQTDPFAPPEREGEPPRFIRVQAEFIELPLATYTDLMEKPRSSANDTDLRATCAELVEAGRARIIETMVMTTFPAQTATAESLDEFIYPTEYEPSPASNQPSVVEPEKRIGMPPIPATAYDVKNTGTTFEVEAQVDASRRIVELRCTPTIVYHTGDQVWSSWTNDDVTIETSMPHFYVLSVKTGTTLVSGQPQMVAALSPKDEKGKMDSSRKLMVFLRADIITVGK